MFQQFCRIGWRGWAAASALTLAGCSKPTSTYDANVQGTVTIDGELARGGTVTFVPKAKGPVAASSISPDGSFSLKIGKGTTTEPNRSLIPSGEYAVAVVVNEPPAKKANDDGSPPVPGARLTADKYASKETSGLEFTVKNGANVFELKLDGAWANPPAEEPADADASTQQPAQDESADAETNSSAPLEADPPSEPSGATTTPPTSTPPSEEAKP